MLLHEQLLRDSLNYSLILRATLQVIKAHIIPHNIHCTVEANIQDTVSSSAHSEENTIQ